MSSAAVDLARETFDRLGAEGYEPLIEKAHPEFVMETPAGLAAEPQRYEGPEGLRRWWTSFFEVMDDVTVVPRSYHDLGNERVAIESMLSAKGQASGIETQQTAIFAVTIRDELLYRIDFYATLEEALATSDSG
jgi:ketosteroid isomerase-like protein